jgi:hypothetical protein
MPWPCCSTTIASRKRWATALSPTGSLSESGSPFFWWKPLRVLTDTMFSIIVSIILIASSVGQVVRIGPIDPDYCYKIESIRPNLDLNKPVSVFGTVTDQQGAPFKNSRVELRKYFSQRKQVIVRAVTTDADGHFDLGSVKPGKYRLLPSPTRAFKQPEKLECPDGSICELKMTLQINPTDQPDSICPIR